MKETIEVKDAKVYWNASQPKYYWLAVTAPDGEKIEILLKEIARQ